MFLFGFGSVKSQCSIEAPANVCLNDIVFFTLKSSSTPSKFTWSFGTYGNSSNAKPSIKVTATGSVTATCEVEFANGSKCNASFTFKVHASPVGKLVIAAGSKLCASGNFVCLKDSSKISGAAIKSISALWWDGTLSKSIAPLTNLCRSFAGAGTYTYSLEVADDFGCKSITSESVTIYPSPSINVVRNLTDNCDSVKMCLKASTNTSYQYSWTEIGTNKKIGNNLEYCRTLKAGEFMNLKCVVANQYGCKDSSLFFEAAPKRTLKAGLSKHKLCASQLGVPDFFAYANQYVDWYLNGALIKSKDSVIIPFANPGWNYIKGVQFKPCKSVFLDSFFVTFIHASGRAYNDIRNKEIDTTFFLDLSRNPAGSKIFREWRFNDVFAPPCTTSRKLKLNVNTNCNYSWDSLARHYYRKKDCQYTAQLYIKDSVSGCESDTQFIICRNDYCGPFITPQIVCLGDPVYFNYSKCAYLKSGKNNVLFTNDKINPKQIVLIPDVVNKYYYQDTGTYSPVFKRLIKNDTVWKDSFGVMVIDSVRKLGWQIDSFKNAIKVLYKPNPLFSITKTGACTNFFVTLNFKDTMWNYPDSLIVDWGDTIEKWSNYKLDYTYLENLQHKYKKGGRYFITATLVSKSKCRASYREKFGNGFTMEIINAPTCNWRKICFTSKVTEVSDTFMKWTKSNGLGTVKWDFGNGNTDTNFIGCTKFQKPGTYKIKLIATDNNGCKDSTETQISSTGPVAAIKKFPLIYCSQIHSFFDSSYIFGNSGSDNIIKWNWDFGDKTLGSSLKNTSHIFVGGGNYNVTLIVTTQLGCSDTLVLPVQVIGPQVKARIISDSIGCAPLKIEFKNNSKQTGNFIWQYKDLNNKIYSTKSDTNVTFVYNNPGVYYPEIIGGDSFYNPNTKSKYFCSVTFPPKGDTSLRVEVFPLALTNFILPDSLCINQYASIKNTSNPKIKSFNWRVDSFNFFNRNYDPLIYQFKSGGKYTVKLISKPTLADKLCADSISKELKIVSHQVNFEQDCSKSKMPRAYFKNTSGLKSNDAFTWEVNKGNSIKLKDEVSRDLLFDYSYDTGKYLVCLQVLDTNLCYDKKCMTFQFNQSLFITNVFTPGKDGFNDVFKIPISGISDFKISIYNRYGAIVFETDNPQTYWNGKVNNSGSELPSGTYFYQITYKENCKDKNSNFKGAVQLIR